MHVHHAGEGKFIHKNRGKREGPHKSSYWRGSQGVRRKFTIANFSAILTLNIVFLANMASFLGSSYGVPTNVHQMRILYVDYDDNSSVSQALNATYNRLRGKGYPTLFRGNPDEFPTPESLRREVCENVQIWGAIYTHAGASERLSAGLSGASMYNSSNAISYISNSARYAIISFVDIRFLTTVQIHDLERQSS